MDTKEYLLNSFFIPSLCCSCLTNKAFELRHVLQITINASSIMVSRVGGDRRVAICFYEFRHTSRRNPEGKLEAGNTRGHQHHTNTPLPSARSGNYLTLR